MRVIHDHEPSNGLLQHLDGLSTRDEGGGDTDLPPRPGNPKARATHERKAKPSHLIEEQVEKKSGYHNRKWKRIVLPNGDEKTNMRGNRPE
jgi:hypothetical protein